MRVLQESRRVLSPNGRIFVSTEFLSLDSKMLQLTLLILFILSFVYQDNEVGSG